MCLPSFKTSPPVSSVGSGNLDDVGMKLLQVDLRPSAKSFEDRSERRAAFGEFERVVSSTRVGVGSFDQLQAGEQFEP